MCARKQTGPLLWWPGFHAASCYLLLLECEGTICWVIVISSLSTCLTGHTYTKRSSRIESLFKIKLSSRSKPARFWAKTKEVRYVKTMLCSKTTLVCKKNLFDRISRFSPLHLKPGQKKKVVEAKEVLWKTWVEPNQGYQNACRNLPSAQKAFYVNNRSKVNVKREY